MTLKIKKVRNITTLNITWVHSGSKMDLFKEIVLLEVYVSLLCVGGGGSELHSIYKSHAVYYMIFIKKNLNCILHL